MRKINVVIATDKPHLSSSFFKTIPLYRHCDTYELTEDATLAISDIDGNPIVVESKPTTIVLDVITSPPKPLSFSPCDPVARSSCFEVFGMLNKKQSSPTIMLDRMQAQRYADNVSLALDAQLKQAIAKSETIIPVVTPKNTENE